MNELANSSIAFSASASRSTTPLTMLPNTLIGEKPPAVAPLITNSPISTGLMPYWIAKPSATGATIATAPGTTAPEAVRTAVTRNITHGIAAVLSLFNPAIAKDAVNKIAWPTVLLISGIVMYVGLLETLGSIDWLGEQVATINSALIAALLICYVGGIVSAFASTTGILAALIPLAVPLLETGAIGAVGLIIALSISSSVVDSSPFSTSGALTVANTPESHRDLVFKRLMQWGMSMVVIAPPVAWLIFVVPGWL